MCVEIRRQLAEVSFLRLLRLPWRLNQVVRLGGKHLYPLSHPASSQPPGTFHTCCVTSHFVGFLSSLIAEVGNMTAENIWVQVASLVPSHRANSIKEFFVPSFLSFPIGKGGGDGGGLALSPAGSKQHLQGQETSG